MLSSENGIDMLKTLSIIVGFPFAIIKIISLFALMKAIKQEKAPCTGKKAEPDGGQSPAGEECIS